MKNNPLVSIIVPIYNLQDYLDKCIQSLINQTYKNLEIILINDGSTDESLKICEKYKKRDTRIILINNDNMGVSYSRNIGIKKASGEYIMCVDGDDWLDVYCLEECINNLDEDIDVILFPYIREYPNKSLIRNLFDKTKKFNKIETKKLICKRFFGLDNNHISNPTNLENLSPVWGKLYLSKKIKGQKFIDIDIIGNEDALFNIGVFMNVNKAKYINTTYYHYRKENTNSLTRKYNDKLLERWKNLYKYMQAYIDNYNLGIDFQEALNNRIVINLLNYTLNITNSNLKYKEKKKKILEILNDEIFIDRFIKFEFSNLEFKWRLFYKSCYKKRVTFIILLNYCMNILKSVK